MLGYPDAMNILSEAAAFTQNTKAGKTPETYFQTIHRMLKPLLAALAMASQGLEDTRKMRFLEVG